MRRDIVKEKLVEVLMRQPQTPGHRQAPECPGSQQQAPSRDCENVMKLLQASSETIRGVGLGKLRDMCGEEAIEGNTAQEFATAVFETNSDQGILDALRDMLVAASERHQQRKRATPSV